MVQVDTGDSPVLTAMADRTVVVIPDVTTEAHRPTRLRRRANRPA
jgi:hypothetical protein